jgi:hypothetical protein
MTNSTGDSQSWPPGPGVWVGVNFWSRAGGPHVGSLRPGSCTPGTGGPGGAGCTLTRSFCYWPDFMPEPEALDEEVMGRFVVGRVACSGPPFGGRHPTREHRRRSLGHRGHGQRQRFFLAPAGAFGRLHRPERARRARPRLLASGAGRCRTFSRRRRGPARTPAQPGRGGLDGAVHVPSGAHGRFDAEEGC